MPFISWIWLKQSTGLQFIPENLKGKFFKHLLFLFKLWCRSYWFRKKVRPIAMYQARQRALARRLKRHRPADRHTRKEARLAEIPFAWTLFPRWQFQLPAEWAPFLHGFCDFLPGYPLLIANPGSIIIVNWSSMINCRSPLVQGHA